MKRPLILIAALTGSLALAGCGDDAPTQSSIQAQQDTQAEQSAEAGQSTRTLEGILEFDGGRQALPEEAEVVVSLRDVALADAPATIIAEQRITPEEDGTTQFRLDYATDAVSVGHAHALHAAIRGPGGTLQWTTTERHAVEVGPDAGQGPITLVLAPVNGTPLGADAASEDQQSLQEAQAALLEGDDSGDAKASEADSVEDVSEQASEMQEPSDAAAGDDTETANNAESS